MLCQSSSVINGVKGCSSSNVWRRHKSWAARTVSFADSSAILAFETSRYQPQKSFQKNA